MNIRLASRTVPGFARPLSGAELEYHAPIPGVHRSLVVRSEDADLSIAWETAPVSDGPLPDHPITFAMLAGIDVNEDRRSFELSIDGRSVLEFCNPAVGREEILAWDGREGVRAEFRVTLIDRYSDAMGYLFLHVPSRLVRPGEPLRLEVRGESAGQRTWFMVFAHALRPAISIRPLPVVVRSPRGPLQEVRVDLVRLDEGGPVWLESPSGRIDGRAGFGHTRLSMDIPAVDHPTAVPLTIGLGTERFEAAVRVEPVKPLTIHLIHHTHLDIGYTHHQEEVERLQWDHLETALQLGERSEAMPPDARFVWHPEAVWAVETYLENHGPEENGRLLDGIRRGWIHLDALHTNLLTGIATGEGLIRALEPGRRLAERTGVPIRSAMFTDIPGFAWGLVSVLGGAGIRYFSVGPNRGHRIGAFLSALGDRPFWWESPNGEHRVLVWVHGEGYSLFHTGLGYERLDKRLDAELVLASVDRLRARGWDHPLTALRYNIGSDNGPPDPTLSATVAEWNERYESPRLAIGSAESVFAELEECCGADLPVVRADLTGFWEDGAASSARETQSIRHTAEWLVAAETLAALDGAVLDPQDVYAAWRQVLLFYEHTWGAWNSISEPESEFVLRQWERKQEFAREAAERTNELVAATLAARVEVETASTESTGLVEVVNPLAWTRSEVVILDRIGAGEAAGARTAEGVLIPFQKLGDGGIAFQCPQVPGFASRHVRLVGEADLADPTGQPDDRRDEHVTVHADVAHGLVLDNGVIQVGLDPLTGRIASLRRVDGSGPGRNLVPVGEALAEWLYVRGRDPGAAQPAGGGSVEVTDTGPLVWRAVLRREAAGTRDGLSITIRMKAGSDRLEIEARFDKERSLEPEAVLLRFPAALSAGSASRTIGGAWAPFRAGEDQAAGANRNYYTVERWADLHDHAGGLTLVSVDAPLIQLGSIGSDPIVTGWRETLDPAPVLLSYLMNNYWETNYRAEQEGPHAIRYVLRPHGGFDVSEAERIGLEEAHPLLAYRARDGVEPFEPPVVVESERSVVTSLRRTADSLELRLFNPAGAPDEVRISVPGKREVAVVPAAFTVRPGQIVTATIALG